MARLRSDSAKTKKETTRKTSTASRGCKNGKSSATVTKDPISSKANVRSVKREIKPPADSLQKSTKSGGKATDEALKNGEFPSMFCKSYLHKIDCVLYTVDQKLR